MPGCQHTPNSDRTRGRLVRLVEEGGQLVGLADLLLLLVLLLLLLVVVVVVV